jgi:glycosyltransferase involved in cell wall biosynthesis
MKVAFLAGTLGRGGAERQLLYMLKALSKEGIDTRVLCLTQGEAFERDILYLGLRVECVGQSRNRLVRLGRLIQDLRKTPVDILQSTHFFTNMYAAMAGRAVGIPTIGAIRGDLMHAIDANGNLGQLHLRWPHHLIANSASAASNAVQRGIDPKRVDFVRNAVALGPERVKETSDGRKLNIIFAGRLVPLKRPEVFLKLASKLLADVPHQSLNFQVVGDGPIKEPMMILAEELRLSPDNVEFLGEVSDMENIYQRADILVLTSEHEGTPNVILEAMSHGVAVVATRVGGVPDIVPSECGILVEPDDLNGLFDSVSSLIFDDDLRERTGSNAREYVRKNHSIEYLQEKLTSIYVNLMERRGNTAK